jgi:hypothetical protein
MTAKKQDELDRVLDAALAKYATVEPREGLADRVLANLRAGWAPVPDPRWWRSSVMAAVAAVAAVVIVAVTLSWKSASPSHPGVANHSSTTLQAPRNRPPIVSNGDRNGVRPPGPGPGRKVTAHRTRTQVATAGRPGLGSPKLDQFPSPRPLSEQETILANYVSRYPEHAALIARARTEALRRDQVEEMRDAPSGNQQDSQHQDR